MLEKSSSAAVRSGDWLARIVPKALIVLMALCVVLGGIWTFYNVKWSAQLTRQLEAWQAAGLPMSMSDVIPQPIPATQNAAPVYLQVFHVSFDPSSQASRSSSDLAGLSRDEVERLDDYRLGRERDKNAAAVRGILERPQVADTLAALKQASEYPKAVFPIKWQLGYSVILPHLAKFRSATRLVAVQAIVLAEDNRLEEALDWCLTGRGRSRRPGAVAGRSVGRNGDARHDLWSHRRDHLRPSAAFDHHAVLAAASTGS